MPVELLVSRATPPEAALMASLHATCFDPPWNEAAMANFIVAPGTLCLVGFAGDCGPVPGGLLIARCAGDEADLLTLGVVPACRRVGLGRALLKRAVAELRASGTARLFLEVDECNEAALALYRSFGAEPIGRRANYYENGADAAIFSLALSDPHSDDGQTAEESPGQR
jgi:ribosomal-protein-alanine N-acetyltransferase